jgi:hypothetical protein
MLPTAPSLKDEEKPSKKRITKIRDMKNHPKVAGLLPRRVARVTSS